MKTLEEVKEHFKDAKEVKYINIDKIDEYPKVMLVWDTNENAATKRVVISKFNNFYVCLTNTKSLDAIENANGVVAYKHAKDLPTIKEVTMSEVAEAMGIEESLLRIKK